MQIKQTIQKPTCIITIGDINSNATHNKPAFESLFTQAVDETFSCLGCKQKIYQQLEIKYDVTPQAIAENLDAFAAALKDMFGDASLLIELKIMSLLHSKTPKIKYHLSAKETLDFCSYLKNLKAFLS
jgi:hypothetical protein